MGRLSLWEKGGQRPSSPLPTRISRRGSSRLRSPLGYSERMNLGDLRRLIVPEKDALRAQGVIALYVFGSLARGDAGPKSDVDLIVDYDPASDFNLFDLAGVHRRLSGAAGYERRCRDAGRDSPPNS